MNEKSLLQLLRENGETGRIPFHMPGHKRNTERFPHLQNLSAAEDITEIDGFDNLHGAEGILAEAMCGAADLWHSDRSYFLINGSSCGILAGIRALTKRGDTVIVSRNAHKSVYHAIEICGLRPVFLTPSWDGERGMFLSLPPAVVDDALTRYPEASLVILTSPTYEGVLSDVASIARSAHEHDASLLVDEAHGAHLLGDPFPQGAVRSGADIAVQSLHKTLPSLTQTAVLHVCGSRVDPARLEHQLAVFETSSPSYLLMASMDGCVRALRENPELLADWDRRLAQFEWELGLLRHLQIPYHGADAAQIPGVFAFDPSKIYVSTAASDWSGERLADFLRQRNLEPEMTARDGVLLMTGAGDTAEQMQILASVLREADALCGQGRGMAESALPPLPEAGACSPEEALERPWEFIPAEKAHGRISAEYVWAYPPGIPILIPGQTVPDGLLACREDAPRLHSTRGQLPKRIAVLR